METHFREIYEKYTLKAHGIIVVVNPPRPAEEGTLKTVRLLTSCGVSSKHIIFAFNKLGQITYNDGSRLNRVELDGLIGPPEASHEEAIEMAKKTFVGDLQQGVPAASFTAQQIVEYELVIGLEPAQNVAGCGRVPSVRDTWTLK